VKLPEDLTSAIRGIENIFLKEKPWGNDEDKMGPGRPPVFDRFGNNVSGEGDQSKEDEKNRPE